MVRDKNVKIGKKALNAFLLICCCFNNDLSHKLLNGPARGSLFFYNQLINIF